MNKKLYVLPLLAVFLLALTPVNAASTQINMTIDGPAIIYPAEQVQWAVTLSANGQFLTPALLASICGCATPTFSLNAQLVNTVTNGITVVAASTAQFGNPTAGIYTVTYGVPSNAVAGFYALVVAFSSNATNVVLPPIVTKGYQISAGFMGMQSQLTSIQSALTAIRTQIATLNDSVIALSTKLTNINTTLVTKITGLSTQLTTINSTLITIRNAQVSMQTDITSLKASMTTLASSVNNLANQVSNSTAQITAMQAQLTTANNGINSVLTQINSLKNMTTSINTAMGLLPSNLNTNMNNNLNSNFSVTYLPYITAIFAAIAAVAAIAAWLKRQSGYQGPSVRTVLQPNTASGAIIGPVNPQPRTIVPVQPSESGILGKLTRKK